MTGTIKIKLPKVRHQTHLPLTENNTQMYLLLVNGGGGRVCLAVDKTFLRIVEIVDLYKNIDNKNKNKNNN